MRIKEWKYNEIMSKVTGYGDLWENMEVERDSANFDTPKVTDGFVKFTCRCEILKETEKAVFVEIANCWKEWLPKSAVIM